MIHIDQLAVILRNAKAALLAHAHTEAIGLNSQHRTAKVIKQLKWAIGEIETIKHGEKTHATIRKISTENLK